MPCEQDAAGDAQCLGPLLQPGSVRTVTDEHNPRLRVLLQHPRRGCQEIKLPLLGAQTADVANQTRILGQRELLTDESGLMILTTVVVGHDAIVNDRDF